MIQQYGTGPGSLNPAIGFARFLAPGSRLIGQNRTPLANGANTNNLYQDFTGLPVIGGFTVIPAGLLARNGDALVFNVRHTLSAAVSTKTYQINLGFTARAVGGFTGGNNLQTNGSAIASTDIDVDAMIVRISATQAAFWSLAKFMQGAAQGQAYTTAAVNWLAAQPVAVSILDSVGNAAAITCQYAQVVYVPSFL